MASSSEKSVNLPEKSSFSQTCSLLSQYLKEGGSFGDHSLGISSSFGDLSLGISSNIEANGVPEIPRRPAATTMNLFPVGDNSGQDVSARNMAAPRNWESMNLFPHQAGFAPKNDTRNMIDSSLNKPAPQNAQMTIFYGGQVIVFNDFPADKANEIMQLASNGSSLSHGATYPPMQLPAQSYNSFAAGLPKSPVESTPPVSPGPPKIPTEPSCSVPPQSNSIPNFGNNLIPERPQPPSRTCDLPIARRNSLHRFLEKRKDRIVARAPYQVNGSAGGPDKPADSKPWLGLAAQTSQ